MLNSSFRRCAFFLFMTVWVTPRVQAVSTYTCTTFAEGGYPTGINNEGHIAGSFFFVDKDGMNLPFTVPPFAVSPNYMISAVNNAGQVAGTALDSTLSTPLYRGFISNADGTYSVIEPPASTPDQGFSDVFVFGINDRGETSGTLPITSPDNLTRNYSFTRDVAGFFTFFDPGAPYTRSTFPPNISNFIGPLFQSKINNAGVVLLGNPFTNTLRLPDGSEKRLVYRVGPARYYPNGEDFESGTFYGMNNTGMIVGDAFAPFVMDPDGNAPAVVCSDYRDRLNLLRAYSINDNGVIAGGIGFSGAVFVATPTGSHSGMQLSNTSWGFSPSPAGVQGGSGIIYVSSTGAADLNFVSISIGVRDGADSPTDFTITGNTCMAQRYTAAALAPGQSCTISFTFTPNGAGARTAQIQIEDDAPDGPHLIRLNGMGLGKGRLQFSNDYWQFNQQPVGQPSGPGVIYIYNPGTDAINFSSIAISGGNSSDFAIGANSCGAAIAPYTTCAIAFQFTPQAAGGRSSTLVFIDDSSTGRQAIPLTGTGY